MRSSFLCSARFCFCSRFLSLSCSLMALRNSLSFSISAFRSCLSCSFAILFSDSFCFCSSVLASFLKTIGSISYASPYCDNLNKVIERRSILKQSRAERTLFKDRASRRTSIASFSFIFLQSTSSV